MGSDRLQGNWGTLQVGVIATMADENDSVFGLRFETAIVDLFDMGTQLKRERAPLSRKRYESAQSTGF